MKNITIKTLDIKADKEEINQWAEKYFYLQGFKDIERFILEDYIMFSLAELIEANYEYYAIGNDDIKKAFVAKNDQDEIVGFMICHAYNLTQENSEVYLQYIVVNPKYQREGYGKTMIFEFVSNIREQLGLEDFHITPKSMFARIDRRNSKSLDMFRKLGFNFKFEHNNPYVNAEIETQTLLNTFAGGSNQPLH